MPREKDSFRDYVEFLQNKWKCNFCKKEYSGSVTRIKAHLAGVGGYGINDCKDVDGRVRSEALKALKGETVVESSNRPDKVEEDPHQPVTANDDNARRETSFAAMLRSSDVTRTVGASSSAFLSSSNPSVPAQNVMPEMDFSSWPLPPQCHAGDSSIQLRNLSYPITHPDLALEALTDMPAPVNAEEGEPVTEVLQDARTEDAVVISRPSNGGLVNENVPSLKRKRKERSNREVVNNCCHCRFRKLSTTDATRCMKSPSLLTTELVGEQSEETIKMICDYLMEDEIIIIGIYGMGGVGKTAILMHVHNRVLANPTFNDVFWVTIPQEFSIYELQDEIANVLGLDNLSKVKDMKRRACILYGHLKKKKRSILLLDGMWVHFEVEDVGIPIEQGGLKVVLTTRSLDVCHKMLCQKQVKIEPLCREDDPWNLFSKKLCFQKETTSKVEEIARSIVDECGGLPLGIIEIATHLRGVDKVQAWKGTLRNLKESGVELNVFKTLKLSYMNLGDSQVQQCFLHSMLCYGENSYNKNDLIESFIDEDLLGGIATRQEQHDEGDIILDKIRKACLGDVGGGEEEEWVHPLIRGMALQIVTSTTHMVKACVGLEEIPEENFWTDHLEKVFLQGNKIKKIPYNISPNCPKLTRLSLKNNMFLETIHQSFFKHLKGLKVLNLSSTGLMELPDTISHLENLEALLLQNCKKFCCIPCVQKLGSLRKLDLRGCAMLEQVPEGMEMLVKLTYLDLLGTKIKALPEGALGKLVNLQYLVINYMMVEEVKIELTMVGGLYCSIPNVETFNACVRLVEQNSSQSYDLALSASGNYFFKNKHERRIIIKSCHSIAATVDGEIGGDGHALLPKNVQVLEVGWCSGLTSLCEIGPLNNLEELEIEEWEKLEELGAVHFHCLRRLNITRCTKLKHFLKEGHELRYLRWFKIEGLEELEEINIVAPFLHNIEVYECPKIKWVVKWQLPDTHLRNLRSIKIINCEQLDEIVGGLPPIGATCYLTNIEIEGCNNLQRMLMTHDMLPYLQRVFVKNCKGIEVIIDTAPTMTQSFPNLRELILLNLPELKSICEGTVSCPSIQLVNIIECPKLKRFPLLDNGCRPCFENNITTDELTWQSLEWDSTPLQPREGVSNQRIVKDIRSCDVPAARVDGDIGGGGSNLLPKNVQVLSINGDSRVTSLSEIGPLENLEQLNINLWVKLKELGAVHFPQLQKLCIRSSHELKRLLVEGRELPRLHSFTIAYSQELRGIDLAAPNLHLMEVQSCRKMERVVEWDQLISCLSNLKSIKIYNCEKLEEIIGGPLRIDVGVTCRLTKIEIDKCNNMKGVLLTHNMLLHIRFLRDIGVKNCEGIEEIIGTASKMTLPFFPELKQLVLGNLPKLKRICDPIKGSDHLLNIEIYGCPKLKRIPLELHPLDNDLLSPPPSLGQILTDEKTWQALEWDHPLARVSLEPFIKFISER